MLRRLAEVGCPNKCPKIFSLAAPDVNTIHAIEEISMDAWRRGVYTAPFVAEYR